MPDFDTSLDDSSEGLQGAALRTAQLADAMQNARLPGPPVAVNPPPDFSPPSGSGVMYATNGPARFAGSPIPVNAMNVRTVQGPPPEDPETQMMRKFLSAIPVDQAEKAIQVAQQFQARRAYKRAIDSGEDPTKAFMNYMAMSATSGGMGKPADAIHAMTAMANLARATRAPQMTPSQQANIDLRNREFAERQRQNALKVQADQAKATAAAAKVTAAAEQKQAAEQVKTQKVMIDAERRRLTARLNNAILFQREVDITKKEMGIDDDEKAKEFVEGDINNRLKALDAQEANLGKAPVTPPPVTAAPTATASTKTNPYKQGRIYGKPGNRLKYLGGDPMSEKSWEPVK